MVSVAGLVVVVAIAAVFLMRSLMGRPMFEPGTVAARIAAAGETLDPVEASDRPGGWPVAPGVTLHHFATGEGREVLVVHGGPGIAPERPWRAAERLGGTRLRFYHQRGCGRSSRPITAPPEGSTWRRFTVAEDRLGLAEQIADLERIRRLLGRERLVLVGHSFGALVAALYAAELPERVEALVLVAPAPLFQMPAPGGDLFAQVRARLPAAMVPEYDAHLAESLDFPALARLDDGALAAVYGRFARFYAAAAGRALPAGGPDPAVGGWMRLAVFLSLGRRHDWRPALRRVTAPVLVVHGADDLQPRAVSEQVAGLFPAGRFAVIPGAGHFPFDEQPEAFAAAVGPFLASVASEGAPAVDGAGAESAAP